MPSDPIGENEMLLRLGRGLPPQPRVDTTLTTRMPSTASPQWSGQVRVTQRISHPPVVVREGRQLPGGLSGQFVFLAGSDSPGADGIQFNEPGDPTGTPPVFTEPNPVAKPDCSRAEEKADELVNRLGSESAAERASARKALSDLLKECPVEGGKAVRRGKNAKDNEIAGASRELEKLLDPDALITRCTAAWAEMCLSLRNGIGGAGGWPGLDYRDVKKKQLKGFALMDIATATWDESSAAANQQVIEFLLLQLLTCYADSLARLSSLGANNQAQSMAGAASGLQSALAMLRAGDFSSLTTWLNRICPPPGYDLLNDDAELPRK